MFDILILLLLGSWANPLSLFPDSADVAVKNDLNCASIISIHYVVAGSSTLQGERFSDRIEPGETALLRLPCRFLHRLIFQTDTNVNYRKVNVSVTPGGDTVLVSRADREFGGFFDVILGSRPYPIINTAPVPLASVFIRNDSTCTGSILGANPLLTDETVFLWYDRDTVVIAAMDLEGNMTSDVTLIRGESDSLFSIGIGAFLEDRIQREPGSVMVVNALNGEQIKELEVYPAFGEPFFMDLSPAPLKLWQGVIVPCTGEVEYIIGTDFSGRTYSVDQPDSACGAFIIDWWHLDFDFDFPDGRR